MANLVNIKVDNMCNKYRTNKYLLTNTHNNYDNMCIYITTVVEHKEYVLIIIFQGV